jgi:hypothetical protein
MAEELSIATMPRDYFDVVQLQDPSVLEEFLEQPLTYIAETLTGVLAVGKTGTMVAGGRIVQALLKGKAFQQFGTEFKKLREAGKIPDDFAEHRYGFQAWVELMTIIDEESPDADRLDALKAMFYEVNKVGATDGERVAAYHMWQIAKGLSSGEILLLKAAFELRLAYPGKRGDYGQWESLMAESMGHRIKGLVAVHEKRLTDLLLLSGRNYTQPVGGREESARLTDLGIKVCENIKNYQIVLQEIDSSTADE